MGPLADLVPTGDPDITAFVVIVLLGFAIGIAGHVVRSTILIVLGICLVLLGTIVLPLVLVGGR